MMTRTIFLARLIGLFMLILSISMFVNKAAMITTFSNVMQDRSFLLTFGLIALAAGLAIVLSHNFWSGGALRVAVTVIGWIILIRGLGLLFLPPTTIASLLRAANFEGFYVGYCGVLALIGLCFAVGGFRTARAGDLLPPLHGEGGPPGSREARARGQAPGRVGKSGTSLDGG